MKELHGKKARGFELSIGEEEGRWKALELSSLFISAVSRLVIISPEAAPINDRLGSLFSCH